MALVWQLATVTLTAETVAVCAANATGTVCLCVMQQPVDAVASLRLLPVADKGSCQLALLFDADQTDDSRPWVMLFKTPNARAQFATALNEQWKALYAVNLPSSK